MATRVGVMYLGRLVEVSGGDLFAAPRHPYTRMLLDAVPDLRFTGRSRLPISGESANPIHPPAGCALHPRCPFADERCRRETPPLLEGSPATRCMSAAPTPCDGLSVVRGFQNTRLR